MSTPSQTASLTDFLKSTLTSLYLTVPSKAESTDFTSLFSNTFTPDAVIYANQEKVSLNAFQANFQGDENALSSDTPPTIEWKDVVEEATDNNGGLVAGVFIVTRFLKIKIRASQAQRLNHNVFSAKIIPNNSAQSDKPSNPWKISELFITSIDKAAPIHLQGVPPS